MLFVVMHTYTSPESAMCFYSFWVDVNRDGKDRGGYNWQWLGKTN